MPSAVLPPSLWETVKCDFKSLFPEDVFQMWFEPLVCLESTADSLTLGVPNDFAAIWIHDNYLDLISQRLRLTAGRMVNVRLRKVDSSGQPVAANSTKGNSRTEAPASARSRAAAAEMSITYTGATNFDAGTAYVAADHHQDGDYTPYFFKTTDYGKTWTRLTLGGSPVKSSESRRSNVAGVAGGDGCKFSACNFSRTKSSIGFLTQFAPIGFGISTRSIALNDQSGL